MYACAGRRRNSSRATINPDTKETRQHGKHTELGFMRWHGFTGFGARIPPEYRPLARSQEGIWDSIISAQNNTSRGTCQRSPHRNRRTVSLVSQLDSFSFGDDWKTSPPNQISFSKIKQPCFAELPAPIKPPAHAHKPNPALEHEFICNLWRL